MVPVPALGFTRIVDEPDVAPFNLTYPPVPLLVPIIRGYLKLFCPYPKRAKIKKHANNISFFIMY